MSFSIIKSDVKNPDLLYSKINISDGWREDYLCKSLDGGMSWLKLLNEAGLSTPIISPNDNNKLYISGTTRSVKRPIRFGSRSNDQGKTWTPFSNTTKKGVGFRIYRLFVDPIDFNILYASVSKENDRSQSGQIVKSFDSGKSWEFLDILTKPSIYSIAINPKDNQQLFLSGSGKPIKSKNGGQNWELVNLNIKQPIGGNLTVNKKNSNIMYLSGIDGYGYKSTDAGKHWVIIKKHCKKILINPQRTNEVLCSTSDSIFKSDNAGQSWSSIKIILSTKGVSGFSLVGYSSDGNTIFISRTNSTFNKNNILDTKEDIGKSMDGGTTWEWEDVPRTVLGESFTIDPTNPEIMYFSTNYHLYRSVNGGGDWRIFHQGLFERDYRYTKLLIHPLNPAKLIYFSRLEPDRTEIPEDEGYSWRKLNRLKKFDSIVFNPKKINGLFATFKNEFYESKDMGNHWALIAKSHIDSLPFELQVVSNKVYASSESGVFKMIASPGFTKKADCLFQWIEKKYPHLFSPVPSNSKIWGDYTYRHYKGTNIYLGFFQEQNVHLQQPDEPDSIGDYGKFEYYQNLANCK
ncbi:MAG: hypothetical protein KAH20_04890 [Methylococcales bacterium]|nr:hypothetical protein [Methylococcales bacterium]